MGSFFVVIFYREFARFFLHLCYLTNLTRLHLSYIIRRVGKSNYAYGQKGLIDMTSKFKTIVSLLAAMSVFSAGYVAGNIDDNNVVFDENMIEMDVSDRLSVRNFDKYSSRYAQSFSGDQSVFYERLDSMAKSYLYGNAEPAYMKGRSLYSMQGIKTDDLSISESDIYYIAEYFMYENPQYYFIWNRFYMNRSDGMFYVGIYDKFADVSARNSVTESLFSNIDAWLAECITSDMSDYQKEAAIYRCVCDKLTYDRNTYDQSLYSAAIEQESVCYGYAALFSVMCNAAGIDCLSVYSPAHVWNAVKIDGTWYLVDTTWGDAINGAVDYLNRGTIVLDDVGGHDGCDFCMNHLPAISKYDYVVPASGTDQSENFDLNDYIPTGIQGTRNDTFYDLTWQSRNLADEYRVIIEDDSGNIVFSGKTSARLYRVNGLDEHKNFLAKVCAVVVRETGEIVTDYVHYSIQGTPVPFDTQPSTPSAVVPSAVIESVTSTDGSSKIMWRKGTNVNAYDFGIYLGSDCKDQIVFIPDMTGDGVILNGVPSEFYISLCPKYADGHSGDVLYFKIGVNSSSAHEPMSVAAPVKVNPVVSDFSYVVKSESLGNYKFSWNCSETGVKYELQVSTSSDFGTLLMTNNRLTLNTAILRYLRNDTTYYIRLRAVAGDGRVSDWAMLSIH